MHTRVLLASRALQDRQTAAGASRAGKRSACRVAQEFVHEIQLTLASDLGRLSDMDVSAWIVERALFDLEDAPLHAVLCRHVPAGSSFDEVAVVSQKPVQAVLADLDAVLPQELCQLANEDALLGCRDAVRE